jgi:spore germination protein GerM
MSKPMYFAILTLSALLTTGCAAPREAPPETMQVRVVFTRNEEPHPVLREVRRNESVVRAALEALLRGPTPEERAEGITSWFSPETANFLNRVTIDAEGNALVDFADFRAIIPGASTSAGSAELMWALNGTVFQFEPVRTVDYRIDGSCETFWHFLQTECLIVERPRDRAP